eukprot:TRINITY_DN3157_c0_g1_i10.p3 TRINITY_DN3157_c0_g1~~TRINITY_DN3157_c0_g1_i10.p3  ORF type:complete len:123 (-),score=6.58 TRINITY_DN3157_c0_g1_i10:1309-1677(-)
MSSHSWPDKAGHLVGTWITQLRRARNLAKSPMEKSGACTALHEIDIVGRVRIVRSFTCNGSTLEIVGPANMFLQPLETCWLRYGDVVIQSENPFTRLSKMFMYKGDVMGLLVRQTWMNIISD